MRRLGAAGEFRANVTQGGRAESFELPRDWVQLALRAAAALSAPLAGVDLLPTKAGEVIVLEVNSAPGFRALSQASGVDVAAAIVEFAVTGMGGNDL
jgi:ribosomal protein S6--L-glutamate ligase